MNKKDFMNAIFSVEYAYAGANRIKIETIIISIISLTQFFMRTGSFRICLTAGIATYLITSILWRIPLINIIMIIICSLVWAFLCFGILLNLNALLACFAAIITFLKSISLHKAWLF